MASHYRAGADLELAGGHDLRPRFPFVVRSAGSKGMADIIAAELGRLVLVQCKTTGRMTKAERATFATFAESIGAHALICTWHKEGRAARYPAFSEVMPSGETFPLDRDPANWWPWFNPVAVAGGSE